MINFYLNPEAYELLNDWAVEHRWKVINALPFDRKMSVHLSGGSAEFVGYFKAYPKGGYKFSLKQSNEALFAKGTVNVNGAEGESDFGIRFTLADGVNAEEARHVIQCSVNSLLLSNAFLWFNNLDEQRTVKMLSRNDGESKNIVFRAYQNELYAVPMGSHRSPQGVFNVRGHFRFYKATGKVIWIDSYFKGNSN